MNICSLPKASKEVVQGALSILPSLNGYLYVSARNTAKLRRNFEGRVAKEFARREGLKDMKGDGLCRRVLRLLGRFGGCTKALVGASSPKILRAKFLGTVPSVCRSVYRFPFRKPEFSGQVASRIVELRSSDRKTKVSACELLHALVLHYVATNSANNDQGASSSAIYSRLFLCYCG